MQNVGCSVWVAACGLQSVGCGAGGSRSGRFTTVVAAHGKVITVPCRLAYLGADILYVNVLALAFLAKAAQQLDDDPPAASRVAQEEGE